MAKSGGKIIIFRRSYFLKLVIFFIFIFSFFLTPAPSASAGVTVGGGSSSAPTSGAGGGANGYGKAVWAYYTINNPSESAIIGDSLPGDAWGSSIEISNCGPYGGFWVLQLSTNPNNQFFTAAVNVSSAWNYTWNVINNNNTSIIDKLFYGNSGTVTNATLVGPDRFGTDARNFSGDSLTNALNATAAEESARTAAGWPSSKLVRETFQACSTCQEKWSGLTYAVGYDWEEVQALFEAQNGSSGGCSALNGGAGDDCWASYSQMKYFCYGDNVNIATATFSGSVSVNTTGSGFSLSGDTFTGDGLHNSVSLTPSYKITRTNDAPQNATSEYAITHNDTGNYATSPNKTTKSLTNGQSDTINVDPVSITHSIGANDKKYCFNLRYDDEVVYNNDDASQRNFAGYTQKCITVKNPRATGTANFSAASTLTYIEPHDQLTRSVNNTVGVIDYASRKTDGSYTESYPTSSTYTATFQYSITRGADSNKSNSGFNISTATTGWTIQESTDGGLTWSNRSSGTTNLAASGSHPITSTPTWTLNASNKGRYIYYCQRLAYYTSSNYQSADKKVGSTILNDYVTERTGYGSTSYTTPTCITLRNPRWSESSSDTLSHNIAVKGETTDISATGASTYSDSTTTYETITITPSFKFGHKVWREDTSGFDESDIGSSNMDGVNPAFFQTSMYNNCKYKVATYMYGRERMPSILDLDPANVEAAQQKRCDNGVNERTLNPMLSGYGIELGATSKNSSGSWNSTSTTGYTTTSFHASTSANYRYRLLAGQTKNFSQGTYNYPANWTVGYQHINRCEEYDGAHTGFPLCLYDRTVRLDDEPQATPAPNTYDQPTSTITTYSLFRPYNYEITDISPDNTSASTAAVTWAGQNVGHTFSINITRENEDHAYVTDPYQSTVYVIGYTIKPDQDRASAISPVTKGNTTIGNSGDSTADLCGFYGDSLGFSASNDSRCQILSSGNLADTSNHVYVSNYYGSANKSIKANSYNTGDIFVPNNLELGEKYCISIAVSNYRSRSSTSDQNDYGFAVPDYWVSSSTCSNVAKLPSLQVLSGSVKSAGGIKTSTTQKLTNASTSSYKTYGSWADLAVIANQDIAKMASAASLAHGVSSGARSLCDASYLTIANHQCATTGEVNALGNAGIISDSTTFTKLVSRYTNDTTADVIASTGINNVTDGTNDPEGTSNVFINNGLDPHNFFSYKPLVLYTNNNMTISTNIQLDESRTFSANFAPQVILIAKGNIYIKENVTRLDAWIVTNGTLDTCVKDREGEDDDGMPYGDNELNRNTCTNQLTINGAVLASKARFTRTANGDVNKNTMDIPAEIINFTPTSILFSAREADKSLLPETTYLRELPPRY